MEALLWLEMGGGGWMAGEDLRADLRGFSCVSEAGHGRRGDARLFDRGASKWVATDLVDSVFMGDPELFCLLGCGSFGVETLALSGLAVEGGVEATWEYVSIIVGDGEIVSMLEVG
jgi:hypothetical protein